MKNNAKTILKSMPKTNVRLTLQPQNVNRFREDIAYLENIGFRRINVSMLQEATWTSDDFKVFKEQLEAIDNRAALRFFKRSSGKRRCGAGFSMVAVTTNGRLFPCHRFVDPSDNEWCLGTIWQPNVERIENFRKLFCARNQKCLKCIHRAQCSGGCPYVAYKVTGSPSNIVENHCNYVNSVITGYKTNAKIHSDR